MSALTASSLARSAASFSTRSLFALSVADAATRSKSFSDARRSIARAAALAAMTSGESKSPPSFSLPA